MNPADTKIEDLLSLLGYAILDGAGLIRDFRSLMAERVASPQAEDATTEPTEPNEPDGPVEPDEPTEPNEPDGPVEPDDGVEEPAPAPAPVQTAAPTGPYTLDPTTWPQHPLEDGGSYARTPRRKVRELDGIAYGAGPGSFTGLRIACAVTQGLAFGAGLPVVGISTLESIAEQTGADRVLTVLDARMAEVYWAAYARDGAGWRVMCAPQLALPESVTVPAGEGWVGAGNGFTVLGEALRPRLETQLARIDETLMPDAAAMVPLAEAAFARGEGGDAALAAPIYLRDKVALTVNERRAKAPA